MIRQRFDLICSQTGEVFSINDIQFYNLYENDLIYLNYEKEYWYINEEDINKVNRIIKCL